MTSQARREDHRISAPKSLLPQEVTAFLLFAPKGDIFWQETAAGWKKMPEKKTREIAPQTSPTCFCKDRWDFPGNSMLFGFFGVKKKAESLNGAGGSLPVCRPSAAQGRGMAAAGRCSRGGRRAVRGQRQAESQHCRKKEGKKPRRLINRRDRGTLTPGNSLSRRHDSRTPSKIACFGAFWQQEDTKSAEITPKTYSAFAGEVFHPAGRERAARR